MSSQYFPDHQVFQKDVLLTTVPRKLSASANTFYLLLDFTYAITIATPNTPRIFRAILATTEFSMNVLTPLFIGFKSPVRWRSSLTVPTTLGSRRTMLAYLASKE
jgi:hypothetical protein